VAEYRHVRGVSELVKRIRDLPNVVRRDVLATATGAACVPVRDAAINYAPEYHGEVSKGHPPPGTLKRSIYLTPVKSKWTRDRTVYFVRVRAGEKQLATGRRTTARIFDVTTGERGGKYKYRETVAAGGAFYWWWVEFGTAHMTGRHFMRDAARDGQGEALKTFVEIAEKKMIVAAEKVGWRTKPT
jgi:HK97 gp10 family phage protein